MLLFPFSKWDIRKPVLLPLSPPQQAKASAIAVLLPLPQTGEGKNTRYLSHKTVNSGHRQISRGASRSLPPRTNLVL